MLDSLDNVKSRLGISVTTYDDFLTNQIVLVSDAIEGYCRRKFLEASYAQTFYRGDYRACRMVELFHYPLVEVTGIVEDDVTLDATTYRIHKPTARIIRSSGAFFYPEETVINYSAGLESCPTPVLSVLDSVVQERYNKKISGIDLNFGSDVQRISIPGAISIDFDYTLNNNDRKAAFGVILGSNLNILDNYRSERSILGGGKLIYIEEV